MKGLSHPGTIALGAIFVAVSASGGDLVAQDTLLLDSADLPSRGTVLLTEAIDPAIVDKSVGFPPDPTECDGAGFIRLLIPSLGDEK